MSVEIEPFELGFRRPFTVEVAQILKIKNTNKEPIAFKVKTTAPKQYCVRPNSGRVEPGHEVEVSVLLQAMKQEPPADAKCRDKFLVQSVIITGDKDFTNVQQIWDGVHKSAIQERKIRVSWLAANEDGNAEPGVSTPPRRSLANGHEDTPNAAPPAYSSPHDESTILDNTSPSRPEQESREETGSTVAESAVAAVKATATETYEEIKAKLAQAEATIAQLKNDAASGLRQRKTAATSEADNNNKPSQPELAQATRQGTEGVSVKVVAILCFVSFMLAYFFF
ncbi:PapD-like protein [Triangularia setosa]|uniref:PapD-like protein n=1 Tax=Triangularia setosa TaxID=2587417 RepID=A0AAN7AB18_9PEZI|nr:PapD-like protein [Podospora setosa]